jgi:hypothetical protein
MIDASNALARLGFDRQPSGAAPPAGGVQGKPLSFAWGTSMSMPWALPYWGDTVADIATQGALIAEKLLAFGADQPDVSHVALALLNAVVNDDDGFAHSASNTELHQGHQGSFEGNGELLVRCAGARSRLWEGDCWRDDVVVRFRNRAGGWLAVRKPRDLTNAMPPLLCKLRRQSNPRPAI